MQCSSSEADCCDGLARVVWCSHSFLLHGIQRDCGQAVGLTGVRQTKTSIIRLAGHSFSMRQAVTFSAPYDLLWCGSLMNY